jgi:hypothetical protein
VSQVERRGVRAFSPDVFRRGALDRHPAGCEDHSGADFCSALLHPVEQASADRVIREAEHLKPPRERPGPSDKGESE